MHTKGWDYFSPDSNTVQEKRCRVCNEKMDVQRNVVGKRSMYGLPVPHDCFTCPNSNEKWHMQALHLLQLAESTPSGFLARQLTQEASLVIQLRRVTKEEGVLPDGEQK